MAGNGELLMQFDHGPAGFAVAGFTDIVMLSADLRFGGPGLQTEADIPDNDAAAATLSKIAMKATIVLDGVRYRLVRDD